MVIKGNAKYELTQIKLILKGFDSVSQASK